MAKKKAATGNASQDTAASLRFEGNLWLTADKVRHEGLRTIAEPFSEPEGTYA